MDLSDVEQGAFSGERHPWELARRRVVLDLMAQTPKASSLLDVGCGDAFVLDGFADRALADALYGVDSALSEARQYRRAGIPVSLSTSLDDVDAPADSVSHVLLLDVLEHVEDDVGLLRAITAHPAVRGGAHLLVTVPAHQRLFIEHDRMLRHHRRYSAAQLVDTARAAGVDVVDHGGFFTSLLAPRVASLVKEKLAGPDRRATGVARWQAPGWVTRTIENTLYADYKVGRRLLRRGVFVPGLSLYLVGRLGEGAR